MIVLTYPEGHTESEDWKTRLENMTVPYLVLHSSKHQLFIQEGEKRFERADAINQFLDQYESDLKAWNQDRCDMWFFDEED